MWKSFFIDFQNTGRYNALKEINVYSVSGTDIKLLRFFLFSENNFCYCPDDAYMQGSV